MAKRRYGLVVWRFACITTIAKIPPAALHGNRLSDEARLIWPKGLGWGFLSASSLSVFPIVSDQIDCWYNRIADALATVILTKLGMQDALEIRNADEIAGKVQLGAVTVEQDILMPPSVLPDGPQILKPD